VSDPGWLWWYRTSALMVDVWVHRKGVEAAVAR
jgi:hypothetical protein